MGTAEAAPITAQSTSSARQLIMLINAAHLLTHYTLLILPTAVLVMARPGGAFGTEHGPILALGTGMFVLYGAASLPQGWLAARFGRRRMMTSFFVGTGLSLIAAGCVSSPVGLLLALTATGLFSAIYHPVGTLLRSGIKWSTNAEAATSNALSANGRAIESATRKSTLGNLLRANSICADEGSMPLNEAGAHWALMSSLKAPVPHPMSSHRAWVGGESHSKNFSPIARLQRPIYRSYAGALSKAGLISGIGRNRQ
jgi:hypothetical protein